MRQCLSGYISEFENCTVEPVRTDFLIEAPERVCDTPLKREWLACAVGDCTFKAMLKHSTDGGSEVTYTSDNDVHSKFCKEETQSRYIEISSTSRGGCQAASVSYILNRFGSTIPPETIDGWMEREVGQYPTEIGEHKLVLGLLNSGYEVKKIFPANSVNPIRGLVEGNVVAAEQYVTSWLRYTDNPVLSEWFDTPAFSVDYAATNNYLATFMETAQPYLESGQLSFEWSDLTVHELQELAKNWGIMANKLLEDPQQTYFQLHAVVVEDLATTRTNHVRAEYYTSQVGKPSYIVVKRAGQLNKIFFQSPDFGYLLIRPFEPVK